MSYSRYYELKVHQGAKTIQEVLKELSIEEKFSHLHYYAVDENGNPYEPCFWYDHEIEMKEVSRMYPDLVFELRGEVNECNDIWYKYFKNGKMQACYATLVFDGFDESRLN